MHLFGSRSYSIWHGGEAVPPAHRLSGGIASSGWRRPRAGRSGPPACARAAPSRRRIPPLRRRAGGTASPPCQTMKWVPYPELL
eukprot:scaffold78796_cov57-Phaeocystis_antarctica.AAC.1